MGGRISPLPVPPQNGSAEAPLSVLSCLFGVVLLMRLWGWGPAGGPAGASSCVCAPPSPPRPPFPRRPCLGWPLPGECHSAKTPLLEAPELRQTGECALAGRQRGTFEARTASAKAGHLKKSAESGAERPRPEERPLRSEPELRPKAAEPGSGSGFLLRGWGTAGEFCARSDPHLNELRGGGHPPPRGCPPNFPGPSTSSCGPPHGRSFL